MRCRGTLTFAAATWANGWGIDPRVVGCQGQSAAMALNDRSYVGNPRMPLHDRPRRRRYNRAGDAHELTFSCFRRFQFLRSERTCQWLADSIADARVRHDFALWAYVFMPEHVHMVVYPRRPSCDIADVKQAVKEPVGRTAVRFLRAESPEWLPRIAEKKRNRVRYYFWQKGGGYDRNITEPETLMGMIEYIHLNPVRRGLVDNACAWKWSSAAWFTGVGDSPIPLDGIPPEWLVSG